MTKVRRTIVIAPASSSSAVSAAASSSVDITLTLVVTYEQQEIGLSYFTCVLIPCDETFHIMP